MRLYPVAMVRSDDYEVFSLNKDGKTYSSEIFKQQFPKSLTNEFTLELLENANFIPLIESPKMFTLYHEQKKILNRTQI